jgi:hypothetical protein
MITEETKAEDCRKLSIYNKNMLGFVVKNHWTNGSFSQKKSTEEFSGRNSQSITVVFQREL